MKPKLFMDVDGCLIVEEPRDGYKTFTQDGQSYWYEPEMPGRLQVLNDLFEIVWSSAGWRGAEDSILSPLFGLPENLPMLPVSWTPSGSTGDMRPEKLHEIAALSGTGPTAILDDRMGEHVEEWSKGRSCLLIQPNPAVGMTERQYKLLRTFGRTCSTSDNTGANLLEDFGMLER